MVIAIGAGAAAAMLNETTFDCVFFQSITATLAVPAAATSVLEIEAFNCCELTYVVERLDPFHRTAERVLKLAPETVRVKPLLPAVVEVGERLEIAGLAVAGAAPHAIIATMK